MWRNALTQRADDELVQPLETGATENQISVPLTAQRMRIITASLVLRGSSDIGTRQRFKLPQRQVGQITTAA